MRSYVMWNHAVEADWHRRVNYTLTKGQGCREINGPVQMLSHASRCRVLDVARQRE